METTWDVIFDLSDGLGWRAWTSGYRDEDLARAELPALRDYARVCAEPDATPRVALRKHVTEIIEMEG